MSSTNEITPGGRHALHENPHSSEVGPMDSGGALLPSSRYERENNALRVKLIKLEETVANLCDEMDRLKKENMSLKLNIKRQENDNHSSEYHTDEDELDREVGFSSQWSLKSKGHTYMIPSDMEVTDENETPRESDWILKKKKPKKKRKAESSPEFVEQTQHKPASSDGKTLPFKQDKQAKPKQPPPINLVGIKDYRTVNDVVKSITDKDYKLVALNNDVWKINVQDSDTYRTLTMKLNAEKFQWFTYENKIDRPIKVMARGLHSTCEANEIIEDLQIKGFDIKDAANIIKKERTVNGSGNSAITKKGLPLFMLTFDNKENVQNIYNIRYILNMKVKIEPMRKTSSLIVQCKKCQNFNHTQKYCGREPRCVKCAGNHLTNVCSLNRNVAAKCINCKGQHPANYRGCEVATALQKIRNRGSKAPANRNNPIVSKNTLSQQSNQTVNSLRGNVSYAHVVKKPEDKTNLSNDSQALSAVTKSLEALNKRLDEQSEINKLIFEQLKKLSLGSKKTTSWGIKRQLVKDK